MNITGIVPAMITPLKKNQEINYEATEKLVEKLIENNCSAIFILGTNGEFHMLSNEKKIEFTKLVAKIINKRVPLIVGTGGNSTLEVIDLSEKVIESGADLLSIITPYFIRPNSEELIKHYEEIASTLRFPLMIYNIPKLTGINIGVNTVKVLSENKYIVGLKDSSGDIGNIRSYIDISTNRNFNILCGTDSLILESLKNGGAGAIASTANVVPDIVYNIYDYWTKGDLENAELNQNSLSRVRDLFSNGTLPSVLKCFVKHTGIAAGDPIAPVLPADSEVEEKVIEALEYFQNLREDSR